MLLSGTGRDDAVDWHFKVTSGRRAGAGTSIPVPSNWEMHGFGSYSFGTLDQPRRPDERGLYEHTFTPPAAWRDKTVFIVFEGSMTDTEVWINGASAGAVHRGGFYQFEYDVSGLVDFGRPNSLTVAVDRDSANASINGAERTGDYWNFGGIYRPVYLVAYPAEFIHRFAVDAGADGSLRAEVFLGNVTGTREVRARVRSIRGSVVAPTFSATVTPGEPKVTLTTTVPSPKLWTAETPNLYVLEVGLFDGDEEIHRMTERFGFRTVEVRPGEGIFVNGAKVMLKGINRHSFWPDSGRTTSREISREDILAMKEMNVNAVRLSHYPQDQHFYDYADELGLYVLDELPGWGTAYDTPTARRLVEKLVTRDVNHPSVIFWCNGNEGGWNSDVDGDFALHDPQRRTVLHPSVDDSVFNNVRTTHYRSYETLRGYLADDPNTINMPTEFLHALYDGGAAAGLGDYWDLMADAPNAGGGFIWAFADEGIIRGDQGNRLDVVGDRAPDGVVGPYREREGSFYAIKHIWSPIRANPRDVASIGQRDSVEIAIENRFHFTNTADCAFSWSLLSFPTPAGGSSGHRVVRSGRVSGGVDIAPGESGTLTLRVPPGAAQGADALALTAADSFDREIYRWVWPITTATGHRKRLVSPRRGMVTATEDQAAITMTANGVEVVIDKGTGRLVGLRGNGRPISLTNGPVTVAGTAQLSGLRHEQEGNAYLVHADYHGDVSYVRWRLLASGWLQLEYEYEAEGEHDFLGMSFDYPEAQVGNVRWLGGGPYRVWKNRMSGVSLDVWSKDYDDTATGANLPRRQSWNYPEFKGYHADTYWAVLGTREGDLTVVTEQEDMFLRLYTPQSGPNHGDATAPFPSGDLSFLDGISSMGNKTHVGAETGPSGAPNAGGRHRRCLWFSIEEAEMRLEMGEIGELEGGKTARVDVQVFNISEESRPLRDVRVELKTPDGWSVRPRDTATLKVLRRGESATTTWEVTPPAGSYGQSPLRAHASYLSRRKTERRAWSRSRDVVVGPEVRAPEVIAWYRFDEGTGHTTTDSSGRDLPAQLLGGASWTTGRAGHAVQLNPDGAGGGYVHLPDSIMAGARQATVACWVMLTSRGTWSRIFDFGFNRMAYMCHSPEVRDGMSRFAITINGSGGEQHIHGPVLPTGRWVHLAVTLAGRDGGGRLYLDGVEVAANPDLDLVPMYLGNTTRNYLGRSQYDGDPYLSGAVDELRIFARALSADEIRTIYGDGTNEA